MSRPLLRSVLVLLASLLTACSTTFDKKWNAAAQGNTKATRWEGRWASGTRKDTDGSPHGGRLRCVIVPQPDRSLAASFHANWLCFSGNYDMTFQPAPGGQRHGKIQNYKGTHDLPKILGGTYSYAATVAGDHLVAHYTCNYDQGTFDLRELPPGKK
ncbi:hypothetical protein CfE428DRAFT_3617 [Chthoniobacter flavus Ellin428]|uniref:Lipoprotein n=1 Tax=Chthoniobacter flavus Ellin428 TaxID=497964 RepID=B4D3X9_9BACT|nr:hypothetical protein [Chthoniobacter flavus]EDY18959.1 hypothetical protein CfE428DRAFT_3617 [Chthoniobacter flavus Ellin428]TCO93543.1 hypothetical protein EV701_104247 [Chthoniobacter flavus]